MVKYLILVIGVISFACGFHGLGIIISGIKSDLSYGGHMRYWYEPDVDFISGVLLCVIGHGIALLCYLYFTNT